MFITLRQKYKEKNHSSPRFPLGFFRPHCSSYIILFRGWIYCTVQRGLNKYPYPGREIFRPTPTHIFFCIECRWQELQNIKKTRNNC